MADGELKRHKLICCLIGIAHAHGKRQRLSLRFVEDDANQGPVLVEVVVDVGFEVSLRECAVEERGAVAAQNADVDTVVVILS